MKGDVLASGKARLASFGILEGNQDEMTVDLKILNEYAFEKKYEIDAGEYVELVGKLQRGEPLPHYKWRANEKIPIAPSEVISDEAKGFVPERAKSGYKGTPFGDNVLVKRVSKEHTSSLIIPDSQAGKSDVGFVVSVGDKVISVAEGELVLFDKFASHGAEIELIDDDGMEGHFLLLKEYDLQLRLKKVSTAPPS